MPGLAIKPGIFFYMFEERRYRDQVSAEGFLRTVVSCKESDLFVLSRTDVKEEAGSLLLEARKAIESYIAIDNKFLTTLEPHEVRKGAPLIVRRMAEAAMMFGVGPMAAVAGAVSDHIGEQLSGDVVIENGGDVFLRSERPVTFGLYAGEHSPFTGKVKFTVRSNGKPLGVCTSSGTVGHSLSFGKADAVCVISKNATLADAAATAFCNMIKKNSDIEEVLAQARSFKEITGLIAAIDDRIGIWGEIELIK